MATCIEVRWKNRDGNYASPEKQRELSLKHLLGATEYARIFGEPSTEPRSLVFNSASEAETFKKEIEENYKQHPTYTTQKRKHGAAEIDWTPEIQVVEE